MVKKPSYAAFPLRCLEPKECKGSEALISHAKLLKTSPPPSQLFKATEKIMLTPPTPPSSFRGGPWNSCRPMSS